MTTIPANCQLEHFIRGALITARNQSSHYFHCHWCDFYGYLVEKNQTMKYQVQLALVQAIFLSYHQSLMSLFKKNVSKTQLFNSVEAQTCEDVLAGLLQLQELALVVVSACECEHCGCEKSSNDSEEVGIVSHHWLWSNDDSGQITRHWYWCQDLY